MTSRGRSTSKRERAARRAAKPNQGTQPQGLLTPEVMVKLTWGNYRDLTVPLHGVVSPHVIATIEASTERFCQQFGRDPRPNDPFMWDPDAPTPQFMTAERMRADMIQSMKDAGIRDDLIHAYEKTGLILAEDNLDSASPEQIEAWNAAMAEYHGTPAPRRRRAKSQEQPETVAQEQSGKVAAKVPAKVAKEIAAEMREHGLDPAWVYAFEKTRLFHYPGNESEMKPADQAKWDAAIAEYQALVDDDDDLRGEMLVSLDAGAAQVIQAAARVLKELGVPDNQAPERLILTLTRAAGWLIGFTAANPEDKEHTQRMLKASGEALLRAADDPLRGASGEELAQAIATRQNDGVLTERRAAQEKTAPKLALVPAAPPEWLKRQEEDKRIEGEIHALMLRPEGCTEREVWEALGLERGQAKGRSAWYLARAVRSAHEQFTVRVDKTAGAPRYFAALARA